MTQPIIKMFLLAAIAVVGLFALRGSTRAMHRVLWRGYVVVHPRRPRPSASLFPASTTWIAQSWSASAAAPTCCSTSSW